jgi:hypothetical protein
MPMPKLKTGAVVYGLAAVALLASAVAILQQRGAYAEVSGWPLTASAVGFGLTGFLFAVGAVTRRGLAADDGPWICQNGWLLVIALTAALFAVAVLSDQEAVPILPTGPAVFLPRWIRRMQESYYEGVADAEREIAAVRGVERDGELPPRL